MDLKKLTDETLEQLLRDAEELQSTEIWVAVTNEMNWRLKNE